MYYYAFVDENDIVQNIYSLPTEIAHDQYIQVSSNDQTLIGKHYNRDTLEFEDVYYYAVLNDKSIAVEVTFAYSVISESSYIAITATQYNDGSVIGMYWNGTAWETAPISLIAVASTDTVNYKDENKWLSTKLDEMDSATATNTANVATLSTNLSEVVTNLSTVANNLSALNTAVEGKANASHTHGAADLSGVVKTINGTAPDESGNVAISVTGGGMTANEILTSIKTVDGAGSGLDADTIDGMDASAFALTNHTHAGYLTDNDVSEFVTNSEMTTALSGKADVSHSHTGYATTADVTALATTVGGKADSTHNHDTAYAAINHTHDYAATDHTHSGYATEDHTHDGYATAASVTTLTNTVNGKADTDHTHSGYATTTALNNLSNTVDGKADASHSHSQSDITGLSTALAGKADTSHTHSGYASSSHSHSDYLSTSGGTVSGNLNVNGIFRVNGQQSVYDSGSMITLSTNNRQTMIAGSAIYSKVQISVSSDERLKENIKPVDTGKMIDFIKGIDVKTFNYLGNDTECIGVIAQEIEKNDPDVAKLFVSKNGDGYLAVKAADLVFPLIATVQKLSEEIEQLKK